MSLLLDALKKAAEQKAQKSKQGEIPAATPSDETEITAAAEDLSRLEQGASHGLPQSRRTAEDKTELDDQDSTLAEGTSLSSQMQTGEDETMVFAEEDVSDFLGEPELVRRETKGQGDATDLDQTEFQTRHDALRPGDDTELDQTEYQTHHDTVIPGDDTELEQTEHQTQHDTVLPGDDTELDQTEHQTRHDTLRPGDDTELEQTEYQTHHGADEAEPSDDAIEVQADTLQDEDLSLLLVEHDDTNLIDRTSSTNPQAPDYAQLAGSDDAAADELALVDITQHKLPEDQTETAAATQTSATTAVGSTTQTTQGVNTRMEATSTHTYAPDNYDRTLMKLPSDDASKIFAGMKSDSDVVMTPDYAKKVFLSKSSAQRLQGYKIYAGIAVVILLSIGIYGAFEFQQESDNISTSLRPLKRDPMPGIIKPADVTEDTNLFAESGAKSRTIEIIESADNISETAVVDESLTAAAGDTADESVIVDETVSTDKSVVTESTVEVESSSVVSTPVVSAQTESVETTQTQGIARIETSASQTDDRASTLEIISTSKVAQKDLWLSEAYAAYKAGNDSLAMTRYNQVLEVDPGNRNALLARAAINVQNNDSNAAIKDYQTLLVQNPKDSLALTSLIAVANYSPLEAESQLKLMIRDEPDSPYLNFALANVYGAQNRWQEAQGYYFRALQNNPGDPNYAYNLAVSLEHIAQPAAAVGYYRRALDNIDNGLATFSREVVSQRMEILAQK